MNQKKKMLFLSILLMAIGFASVSTVLYLNGQTFVASNTGDFDVYFSKAVENGTENASIIKDKTHIEFTTELTGIDDKYVLNYDVTNGSKQYDANLVMNCVGGNEYLRVENRFNTTEILPARTTRSGKLTLTVIKAVMEETSISISCEISGNAVERDAAGGDNIETEKIDGYLASVMPVSLEEGDLDQRFIIEKFGSLEKYDEWYKEVCADPTSDTCIQGNGNLLNEYQEWAPNNGCDLWNKIGGIGITPQSIITGSSPSVHFLENEMLPATVMIRNENVEKISIKTSNEVPNNAILSWDASYQQNGSIMAWVVDEDNNNMYEINIGQNGGVKANPNSSLLFRTFHTVNVEGLENLDTSNVVKMDSMFRECDRLTSLNLNNFDTSKVTDMNKMFAECPDLINIETETWDTSNVTNMNRMFYECRALTSLNLSHFNTSKVTDMSYMFDECNALTNLNLSNFNTSSVTNMKWMFYRCGSLTNLDVSSFNTSKVTDMSHMFSECVKLTTLDLNSFDTTNVENMQGMFYECECLRTTITISGTKCTEYDSKYYNYRIFAGAATTSNAKITVNYTEDASDLVDKMIAISSTLHVVKGEKPSYLITVDGNENVKPSSFFGCAGDIISLSSKLKEIVVSFELNGTHIEGSTFRMPNETVTITNIKVTELPSPNVDEIKKVTPDEVFNSNIYFSKFMIEKFGTGEKVDEWEQEVCKDGYESETCQNALNELMNEMNEWAKYLHVFATYRYGSIDNYKEWQSNACADGETSTTCQNAMTQFFNEFKKWKNS